MFFREEKYVKLRISSFCSKVFFPQSDAKLVSTCPCEHSNMRVNQNGHVEDKL